MELQGIFSSGFFETIAALVVTVLTPYVTKKVRDHDIRQAIAQAADAALVLAVKKWRSNGLGDIASLLRLIVEGLMSDPAAPKQLKKSPALAERAAAAAVARNAATLSGIPNK